MNQIEWIYFIYILWHWGWQCKCVFNVKHKVHLLPNDFITPSLLDYFISLDLNKIILSLVELVNSHELSDDGHKLDTQLYKLLLSSN